jgi:hypothetical protein
MEQETKKNPSSHNGHPIAPYIISGSAPTRGFTLHKMQPEQIWGVSEC